MSIYERVISLCSQFNTDKTSVERACGFSQNSINKWQKSAPSIDKIIKVADYFGVSVDYLLGRSVQTEIAERPHMEIADPYQQLLGDTDFLKIAQVYASVQNAVMRGALIGAFLATAKSIGIDTSIVGY